MNEKQYLKYKTLKESIDYFGYIANFFFGIFLIAFIIDSSKSIVVELICAVIILYNFFAMVYFYSTNEKLKRRIEKQ